MSFPPHIWGQLKNITAGELANALERDGWSRDTKGGSSYIYRHSDGRRVSVHMHPRKTYGSKLLKQLLADIGWSERDYIRLKLCK